MTTRVRIMALLASIGCALMAVVCQGTVFLRHGTSSESPDGSGLEKTAYLTKMGVNGGKGQLQILGFDGSFDSAIAALRATLFAGKEDHLKAGDGLAFGIIHSETMVVRVLLTKAGDKCVVFKFEQSPAEFAASLRRTSSHRLNELPVYPGSIPVFSAGNDETDSVIEISSTSADQATAWDFVDSSLRQAGWKTMEKPEHRSKQEAGGAGIYVRGKNICCALVVKRAKGEAESLISLMLHQRKNRNGETINED